MTAPVITTFNIGYMHADLDQWFKLPAKHPNSGQVDEIYMTKRIHSSLGYLTPLEFERGWNHRQLEFAAKTP